MSSFLQTNRIFQMLCAVFVVAVSLPGFAFAQDTDITIEIKDGKKVYRGKPIAWDGKKLLLMRKDGRQSLVPCASESEIKKISNKFKPYKPETIRAKLQKEFGSKYQVSITRNFVVVHPPGDYQKWAHPFEKLYHRFQGYFKTRGMKLDSPEFPMVAIVLRTRKEFDRFLHTYHDYDRDVLGYYSSRSNRIITYDQSAGKSSGHSWFFNADTIIHEAVHQTAFNTGIHSRIGTVPRWLSEGLAMMFEAPGVNNSMFYSDQSDRINRDRLIALQHYYRQNKVDGKLLKMIANDRVFDADPSLAYALAWGVTFYLAEKHPDRYFRFLRNDTKRDSFKDYPQGDRKREFVKVFGNDIQGMEKRIERFIMGLKIPRKQVARN